MSLLSKPKLDPSIVLRFARQALMGDRFLNPDIVSLCPVVVVANRGYYRDSMGEPGHNDVAIFDDASWIVNLITSEVVPYRWNTDPSGLGNNQALDKGFAILKPGIWPFYRGPHKQKGPAWRQFDDETAERMNLGKLFLDGHRSKGEFEVWRGQFGENPEWGYQAINIHWGGDYNTSSWGCQTAPADQWKDFQTRSYELTTNAKQAVLPYILTEQWLQA